MSLNPGGAQAPQSADLSFLSVSAEQCLVAVQQAELAHAVFQQFIWSCDPLNLSLPSEPVSFPSCYQPSPSTSAI